MPKEPKKSKNYRQMSEELAELMAWFESDELDIDEAMAKYEKAMMLIAEMEKYLKSAENKIRKLTL